MGKYTGILLCSDFDGTMYNGKTVPEDNIKAIRHFRANGGLFTVASGRNTEFLLPFFENYSFGVPLINVNGAVFYDADSNQMVRENFMTELEWNKVTSIIEEVSGIRYFRFFKRNDVSSVWLEKGEELSPDNFKNAYKVTLGITGDRAHSDEAVRTISQIVGDGYSIVRSFENYIEILDVENTKSRATRLIADMVGAQKLVCVGDYENDIDMIAAADVGYAVANAIDSVKAVADRVTVSVDDAAIARIIEEL